MAWGLVLRLPGFFLERPSELGDVGEASSLLDAGGERGLAEGRS